MSHTSVVIAPIWQCSCCEIYNFAQAISCQACFRPRPSNPQSQKHSTSNPNKQNNNKQIKDNTLDIDTEDCKSELDLKQDVTLSLRTIPEFDSYPYNKSNDRFFLMTSVKAPFFHNANNRTPIDLVCVIDESGSMDGDRIKLVKKTITFVIKNLQSTDRFGCIAYSSSSRQVLPLTKMDEHGKNMALIACKTINAGGETNLCQGLIDGINMLQNHTVCNVSSIFLFTDGQVTKGPQTYQNIIEAIQNNNKKQKSNSFSTCTVNTFGFGGDHNAKLLQQIATYGHGMYSFIKNVDIISSTFAEALGGLISVIGQQLKVHIEALNGIEISRCLSKGFRVNQVKKGKLFDIFIADIQSEESRDLIFQLKLKEIGAASISYPIVKFCVEYMNVVTQKNDVLSTICTIDRIAGSEIGERNIELDIHNNRLIAAAAMENANIMAQNYDLEGARTVINSVQREILQSPSSSISFCVDLVKDLDRCSEGLVNRMSYSRFGNQYMRMNSNSLTMQRASSSVSSPIQRHYSSTPRLTMISKSQEFTNK